MSAGLYTAPRHDHKGTQPLGCEPGHCREAQRTCQYHIQDVHAPNVWLPAMTMRRAVHAASRVHGFGRGGWCASLLLDRPGAGLMWGLLHCDKVGGYCEDVVQRRADLLRPVPLHERIEEQHASKE
jgi:hypothetical protein